MLWVKERMKIDDAVFFLGNCVATILVVLRLAFGSGVSRWEPWPFGRPMYDMREPDHGACNVYAIHDDIHHYISLD